MTSLLRKSAAATVGAALFALALSSVAPPTDAQEAPAAKVKAKAKTKKKAEPKKADAEDDSEAEPKSSRSTPPDASHRVPMYFGGLGLSDEQKESIYAAEAKFQPQIQELERKADALRERLMVECEDVLTAPQKKALAEARKSASERRKSATARRKAAESEAEPAEPEAEEEEKPAAKKKAATID